MKVRLLITICIFIFIASCTGYKEYTHITIGKDTSISSLNHYREDATAHGIAIGAEKKWHKRFHFGSEISFNHIETDTAELNTIHGCLTGSYDIYKGKKSRIATTLIGGIGVSMNNDFPVLQHKEKGRVKKDSSGITGRIGLRLKYEYTFLEKTNSRNF